jgi:serine protease SohB
MRLRIPFLSTAPVVAVVPLAGMIATGGRFGMQPLNDAGLAPVIERAFARGKPAAVALAINSPGGSPVQSALIAARIRRLADEKKVPVFAFVEDLAASGGYWLATAADEIHVDAASIVGSIGVISAGFGFHGLLERYGVERRVYTAGKDKSLLDPFRPERAEDVERLKRLQARVHEGFVAQVRDRRGGRLDESADLFSGEVWTGREAVALGLADGIGHLVPTMKERFGDKTKFTTVARRRGLFPRLGATMLGQALDLAEERAAWARYGF